MVRIKRRQFLNFIEGLTFASVTPKFNQIAQGMSTKEPEIVIEVWSLEGEPLNIKSLSQLYFLDLQDEPLTRPPRRVEAGKFISQIPPFPFAIALRMPVEGFGEVTLYTDNQGQGYTLADFPLNLNVALAQSRLYRVRSALSMWEQEGFSFSDAIIQRLEKSQAYLNKAMETEHLLEQLKYANLSLSESLWAGEEAVFSQAQQRISQQNSRPDFLFGCNFFRHPEAGTTYDRYFQELFNFATVPFYWSSFEPEPGKKKFAEVDVKINWLNDHQIIPKGHPLVWFHPAGIPEWIEDKSYEEIKQLTQNRIREIISYYGNKIPFYDIINEPHALSWANALNYSLDQFIELTQMTADTVGKINPNITRIINNCALWGENIPYHKPPQHSPYEYLKACISRNIPFEVIGLQLYYPDQDMFEINRLLERFSQLGKPIHITELGVSSDTKTDENSYLKEPLGLWRQPWNQTIQADWIEEFYTLCYSKPYIKAISWWDLADGGNFWPHGGLLDPNMQPKESFYRLKNLLTTWRKG